MKGFLLKLLKNTSEQVYFLSTLQARQLRHN